MASIYENVSLSYLKENGQVYQQTDSVLTVRLEKEFEDAAIKLYDGDHLLLRIPLTNHTDYSCVGRHSFVFTLDNNSILLRFDSEAAVKSFQKAVKFKDIRRSSVFNDRTDDASATQYFQFYGYLSQQQNMMQDYTRTSTYQRAMLANVHDFRDKVVLDVGAGSGILSFFAIQAGAKKVYAIEASSMAQHAETLVHSNKLTGKIIVLPGKVEEIDVPEPVDVIISEPMGYMLFNERMLESYLHAKKWLKTGGKMFPTRGDLHIAPFTDDALFMEQFSKSNFWYQQSFHGVDLSSLRTAAVKEYFRQPIVDTFDIRICMSRTHCYTVDFQLADETDLHKIDIPLQFQLLTSGTVHGLAFWFDVAFIGSVETVWLSTAPTEPLTHWYQVRCLLETPIFAKEGQILSGKVILNSNKRQSYDVDIELYVEGTNAKSSNTLDLKNPFFRYTGQAPLPPPGHNNISPTESYWNSLNSQTNAMTGGLQTVNGYQTVVNGVIEIDSSQQQQHHNQNAANLVPLGNSGATIHPGSIPSFGNLSTQRQSHVPTSSIGGGVSPALLTQTQQAVVMGNTSHYPVSNTFMIGDYVTPGNIILPGQGPFGQ